MTNPSNSMVCIGAVLGPHGVRGVLKVKALLEEPASFASLGPVHFGAHGEDWGEPVPVVTASVHKQDVLIVRLDGIADRETAEALKGTQLFVPEDRLEPVEGDEAYVRDLDGLAVLDEAGEKLGIIAAVSNFGASDILEIELAGSGKTVMVPFTEEAVPQVDLAAGHVVIDPVYMA
ncbi:MAG: ribosome maturation factor RimM [Sphingomonadales bacterium]